MNIRPLDSSHCDPVRLRVFGLYALLALVGLCGSGAFAQTTFHVAPSGNDAGSCGSTASPCRNIQRALNLASSGDTVKVAAGTYTYVGSLDTACTSLTQRTAVVCLLANPSFGQGEIVLLGGFTTSNWVTANPVANLTTIDGQNQWRGVRVEDPNPADSQPASLRMEGFTVVRGLADRDAAPNDEFAFGGGLDAARANVILRDLVFRDNRAIGPNLATPQGGWGLGGGASIRSAPGVNIVERVLFDGNEARGGQGTEAGGFGIGGGLLTSGPQPTITVVQVSDVVFTDNEATGGPTNGDGVLGAFGERGDGQGGGVAFQGGSNATAVGLVATGNVATGGAASDSIGSAGGAFGGAVFAEFATVSLTDLDLRNNLAQGGNADDGGLGAGGAVMTSDSDLVGSRWTVIDNISRGGNASGGTLGAAGGGAGYFQGPNSNITIDISNSIMADNVVELGSGGTTQGGGGGALFFIQATAELEHLTLARNQVVPSMQGSAMVLVGNANVVDLDYSIISDHTQDASASALHVQAGSSLTLDRGLFAGNVSNTSGSVSGLGTMLSAGSAGYVSPGPPNFDYHITPGSPVIDEATGSSATIDVDGQSRDADPDIGADELGGAPVIFIDGFETGNTGVWSGAIS